MSDAYLGEIRCFGFNFAPVNWALCNGQILSIQQYTALFSILGTNYGGNGTSTFALPNLQGAVPMDWGNGLGLTPTVIGETLGNPTETVIYSQMPVHQHAIHAFQSQTGNGTKTAIPTNTAYIGDSDPDAAFSNVTASLGTGFSPKAIGIAYSGPQPHENMQPYLALTFCICMNGIFPPRG